MTADAPDAKLKRLLDDLGIARPHLAARRADLDSERLPPHAQHLYAVDTNIIYFIGQPITKIISQDKISELHGYGHGGSRKQVPHIGSIFRDDPRDFHLIVGASLARFLVSSLSGRKPLLLPTALWPEVDTMLANYATMDDPETLKLADELFDEMMARSVDGLLRNLGENVDREAVRLSLQQLIQQKIGRHQGLSRLENMLSDGKIDSLAARPVKSIAGQRRQLADWQNEQREVEDGLIGKWDAALLAVGKTSTPHRNLDAKALTQIQLRNSFAREMGSSERIIYVTADAHVLLAAEDMPADGPEKNFAEAYVRHPIAYLNDIGLGFGSAADVRNAAPASETSSILDWIDVLLAQSTDLRNRADRKAADDIRSSWQALSKIQKDQLSVQLGLEEIERLARDELASEDPKQAVANLQEAAMRGEAEAWRRCFDIAIELALRKNPSDHQRVTRSSPPICFEAWPAAGAAIEQFRQWGSDGVPTREAYGTARRQLETGEDSTGYAYYLASATFFAARGDWVPAAGLAAFSRTVASRQIPDDDNGARGREASYFEAVARRHLAKVRDDLARPAELLGECLRIYASEKARWDGPMGIVPERFDLEKLDIEQTKLLFRWADDGDPERFEPDIISLLAGYRRLQGKVLAPQVDAWLGGEIPKPILGSEGYALIQCEVRTIISALLLLTIDALPRGRFPVTLVGNLLERLGSLRGETTRISQRVALPPTQDSSFLAEIAVVIARTLASEATGRRQDVARLRAARSELSRPVLRSHHLYPFDQRRFEAMRAILTRGLRT